jgi:hypothetical protein
LQQHHTKWNSAFAVIPPSEHLAPCVNVPAPDEKAWNLFVFRKSRESLSTSNLLDDLRSEIQCLSSGTGSVVDALVRAGEIETGLEDAGSQAAPRIAKLVDELAVAACADNQPSPGCLRLLEGVEFPHAIRCSHPEGFSYYGLNPLDFADLARSMSATEISKRVAVIGIRSVGSTLGAVVVATLQAQGRAADRITVRPGGEPYGRTTTFASAQLQWIHEHCSHHADFLVVDEGPGFSGSTFVSVTRALVRAGVPPSRITLLGSRPFPSHTADCGLAAEWQQFRSHTIDYGRRAPRDAGRSLGGGAWRELLCPERSHWPACWKDQERIKHLSRDGRLFFKFEGFGRSGHLARTQAEALAEAGFSPRVFGWDAGFAAYEFISGRPLRAADLDAGMLSRMAAYCTFRLANFGSPGCNVSMLEEMFAVNLEVEFGRTAPIIHLHLPVEHPVYPDCRMLPHEWLLTTKGDVLKTDSVGHGEGHQLPGPMDIAWDLAGVISEWKLSSAQADFFLDEYHRHSGDNARPRLPDYLLAYSILRTAQWRMAAGSAGSHDDGPDLHNVYMAHRTTLQGLLEYRRINSPVCSGVDALPNL